jgi:hypothetical protein
MGDGTLNHARAVGRLARLIGNHVEGAMRIAPFVVSSALAPRRWRTRWPDPGIGATGKLRHAPSARPSVDPNRGLPAAAKGNP